MAGTGGGRVTAQRPWLLELKLPLALTTSEKLKVQEKSQDKGKRKEEKLKGLENSSRRHKKVQRKKRKRSACFCTQGQRKPRKNLEKTFPEELTKWSKQKLKK